MSVDVVYTQNMAVKGDVVYNYCLVLYNTALVVKSNRLTELFEKIEKQSSSGLCMYNA